MLEVPLEATADILRGMEERDRRDLRRAKVMPLPAMLCSDVVDHESNGVVVARKAAGPGEEREKDFEGGQTR